jgi:hypothetical protein
LREDMNVDLAHKLAEKEARVRGRWEDVLEVLEAIALGLVAVATAWAGFQSARWDGRHALLYGRATTLRIEADENLTLGGQQRLLDVSTFNTWIQAKTRGEDELADLYVRRFSFEYREAFDAWLKTDPFQNPDAPPGPTYMAAYENPQLEEGQELNERATEIFDEGTDARETSEQYVRLTVLLATVLFLIALSQRFRRRGVRIGLLVVATSLFVYDVVSLLALPRF